MSSNLIPALACRDVTVRYGAVTALENVSLEFATGGIHAVLGQNGAGKTTFARVCAGILRPDSGTLVVNGSEIEAGRVDRARAAGVELVHQNFALPPSFTIAEAMEFGARGHGFLFSRRSLVERWRAHLHDMGVEAKLDTLIRDLPVETAQAVEIARALSREAKILILDEPTAVLAPGGVERLFARVKRLQQHGVTILLVLHKIREVLAIAETASVLRAGQLIEANLPVQGLSPEALACSIIGSNEDLPAEDVAAQTGLGVVTAPLPHALPTGSLVLEMDGVETAGAPGLEAFSLQIRHGEIVGVAGVEGNGQHGLLKAIAGLVPLSDGSIRIAGQQAARLSLRERRALGVGIIPFDRNTEGLTLTSCLWENWSARQLVLESPLRLINPAKLRGACSEHLKQWKVRFADVGQNAGALSGGNAQKVILAREIDATSQLLLVAQPTRGLDIGATEFVWQSLRAARDRGCGVLLISSDLDELFDICDRVVVMLGGRIEGEFKPPYDLAAIGAAMTGAVRV